jgi:ATP-binding cassette subfamily B multidrug efflux pump
VLASTKLPSGVRDVLRTVDFTPGSGMDFTAIGRSLGLVALIYCCASLLLAFQGRITTSLVQRAVYRMRQDAQAKLSRLPLSYFDGQPRGEMLSRVTNDIDNLAQTLQQTLSQIALSLLTIVGVLTMMFWISWELSLLALVTIPVSVWLAAKIGKRAQPQFVKQWGTTGGSTARSRSSTPGTPWSRSSAGSRRRSRSSTSATRRCTGLASRRSSSPAASSPR